MHREALAHRNRALTREMQRVTPKQRLRSRLLRLIAKAPLPPQRSQTERLLIIRPDHLGDALLATPAIQALKAARPKLEIHALCGAWSAELLAHYPAIDTVLTLPFPGFRRDGAAAQNPYTLALRSARWLRQIGYSSALILRPDHWWGALLAYLAGIRQRIGYDLSDTAPFLTAAYRHQHQHAVLQNLRLVEGWTGAIERGNIRLSFPVNATDRNYIDKRLTDWGIAPTRALVCIHPGSGAPSKIWQADKWARVADSIASQYDAALLFTGGAGEAALISDISAKMQAQTYSIAGETNIGQLAALYQRAAAVLGPDSGALHLAAAVQTATVALFGPADPVEFAPWGKPERHAVLSAPLACRPCRILDWRADQPEYHPCVRDITVEQVLDAAWRVLP